MLVLKMTIHLCVANTIKKIEALRMHSEWPKMTHIFLGVNGLANMKLSHKSLLSSRLTVSHVSSH